MSSNEVGELDPLTAFDEVKEVDAKKQINDWAGKSDINGNQSHFDIISEEQEGIYNP